MKFSVTIPTYKSRFLKEAIESVVSQTYADWELIVVDDCSPEPLKEIVEPFLSDRRISYYRNEKNCGAVNVVENWNICLSYCTGDYVICMGDDDRLLPNCLEIYKKLIEKHPTLNVYHTRTEIINEKGDVIDVQEERPEWESVLSLIWNRWAHRNKQFIGDFCYATEYLKHAGGYYHLPLAWGSDDITAAMAAKEKGIANTQAYGFQYRTNSQTITSSSDYAWVKLKATLTQYKWFGELLKELSTKTLSEEDAYYISTIEKPRKDYYFNSMGKDCTDYVKGHPLRLLECYKLLKPVKFSSFAYLKWYLSSIYHTIKK
jgi:glycosyltransferase involved in cell wall biosynthesis